jgi:DNA (cytosine-5)-methyltransferase 1
MRAVARVPGHVRVGGTALMRAVSLFSGAGGFEVGLERAGIQTVLQAENDPWCLSVLERHWPEVTRVDDVRQVDATAQCGRSRDLARVGSGTHVECMGPARGRRDDATGIDLVYGGFPCQDLSVAGARAGFRGERSSLWFEFQRVLSELRPRWALIENVPGLLSSDGGRDMATVLGGLGELGYGWAYRVLDARWFGVPQRRRRVFIVGCLGDAARAAAVLAVCESCGGHPCAGPRNVGRRCPHA